MDLPNGWMPSTRAERSELTAIQRRELPRAFALNLIPGIGLISAGDVRRGATTLGAALLVAVCAVLFQIGLARDDTASVVPAVIGALLWISLVFGSAARTLPRLLGRHASELVLTQLAWQHRRDARVYSCVRCRGAHAVHGAAWCAGCLLILGHAPLSPHAPQARVLDHHSFPGDFSLRPIVRRYVRWHQETGGSTLFTAEVAEAVQDTLHRAIDRRGLQLLAAFCEPQDPRIMWVHVRRWGVLPNGQQYVVDDVARGRFDGGGRLAERWDFSRGAVLPTAAAPPQSVIGQAA